MSGQRVKPKNSSDHWPRKRSSENGAPSWSSSLKSASARGWGQDQQESKAASSLLQPQAHPAALRSATSRPAE
jgi:hypothetical protein